MEAYDSKYKYKHNVYQIKDPYGLNDRNFYGFTHSIDKNKPRKRRRSYPRDEKKEEPIVAETPQEEEDPHDDVRTNENRESFKMIKTGYLPNFALLSCFNMVCLYL